MELLAIDVMHQITLEDFILLSGIGLLKNCKLSNKLLLLKNELIDR